MSPFNMFILTGCGYRENAVPRFKYKAEVRLQQTPWWDSKICISYLIFNVFCSGARPQDTDILWKNVYERSQEVKVAKRPGHDESIQVIFV